MMFTFQVVNLVTGKIVTGLLISVGVPTMQGNSAVSPVIFCWKEVSLVTITRPYNIL